MSSRHKKWRSAIVLAQAKGAAKDFLLSRTLRLSSEQAVKAARVSWLHTQFIISSSFDQLWIYFLICRLALQAICRHCSPGSRRRKIKYFTVGGFAIKLRAHEGGWGHSNPSPRHLKYFRTGADNPVKSSQYPHLSAQLFALNIYWNICEVPRAVIPVQFTLERVKWPVMKWEMGSFSESKLSL